MAEPHPRIYWAAPLFTEAQRLFNSALARSISAHGIGVYLPQTYDIDKDAPVWQQRVFARNCTEIDASHAVVAVLDGCLVDDGTAWEVGYAYAIATPIIGVHTDFRTVGREGRVNLMIEQACTEIVEDIHAPEIVEAVWRAVYK